LSYILVKGGNEDEDKDEDVCGKTGAWIADVYTVCK
jgi:hypothetical protein